MEASQSVVLEEVVRQDIEQLIKAGYNEAALGTTSDHYVGGPAKIQILYIFSKRNAEVAFKTTGIPGRQGTAPRSC